MQQFGIHPVGTGYRCNGCPRHLAGGHQFGFEFGRVGPVSPPNCVPGVSESLSIVSTGHSQSSGCDILKLNQQVAKSASKEPRRSIPKLCWCAAPAEFRSAHIDQTGRSSMDVEGRGRTAKLPVTTRACSRKIGAGLQPCLHRAVDLAGISVCNPLTIAMIGCGGRPHRPAKVECRSPTLNRHTMDCSVTAPGRARSASDRGCVETLWPQ